MNVGALPKSFNSISNAYSLGQSFTYYEKMSNLEGRLGDLALRSLGDIVLDKRKQANVYKRPIWVEALIGDSRAERAIADAAQLFDTVSESFESELLGTWQARLPLGDGNIPLKFNFQSTDEPQSRVVALVGDNGTGKSALLASLARVAANPPPVFFGTDALATRTGARVNISRVVSISYGAFDRALSATADEEAQFAASKELVGTFYRGLQRVARAADGSTFTVLKSFDEIEDELWDALSRIKDERRRLALNEAIELVSQVTTLPEELLAQLNTRVPSRVSLEKLSSGQIAVLNILVSLVAFLEPGSLVVIDEPETHLHPPLLSALMRGIFSILDRFSSFCVVATHSAVVAQELRKSNVIVLTRFGDQTTAREPEIETFGESLGILDRYLFGMSRSTPQYLFTLETEAQNPDSQSDGTYEHELSGQARAILLSIRSQIGGKNA